MVLFAGFFRFSTICSEKSVNTHISQSQVNILTISSSAAPKTYTIFPFFICTLYFFTNFAPGGMAEWSNAAVLKTVVPQGTGGSNPSSSAQIT